MISLCGMQLILLNSQKKKKCFFNHILGCVDAAAAVVKIESTVVVNDATLFSVFYG